MPLLKPNEKVLVSSIPYLFGSPKKGDIILFKYSKKTLIKRIKEVLSGKFYVSGDNKSDSLNVGWINKKEIIGRVIRKL